MFAARTGSILASEARASASLKLNQADVIGVDGSVRRAPPKRIGGYGEGETEVKDYRD
jgi:hypothetical protein